MSGYAKLGKEGNKNTEYGADDNSRNVNNGNNGKKKSKKKCCRIIFILLLFVAISAGLVVLLLQTVFKQDNNEANTSKLCMWNATNISYVNGLYSSDGTSKSGYPIYSLSMGDSCAVNATEHKMYLFNSMESIWTISSLKDDTSSTGLRGICTSNTITNITDCNGLWQIPIHHPQRDVITIDGECPRVSCKGLQIRFDQFIQNESCIGTFQTRISDNLYQKGTSDLYLFFNPSLFRWACGDKNDINGCIELDDLVSYSMEQSWYNADELILNDESISMNWSNGHEATIECINTAAPTQSPTLQPSVSPTKSPTMNPTKSPSKAPTIYDDCCRFGLSEWYIWIIVLYVFHVID